MKMKMRLLVLVTSLSLPWTVTSFVPGCTSSYLNQCSGSASRLKSDDEDETFAAHVVASHASILPGEGMTLFLSDEEAVPLIKDCCDNGKKPTGGNVVVAVRLMTGTEPLSLEEHNHDSTSDMSLAQVASLCDITGLQFGSAGDYVQVDLQCTGQVRLHSMLKQYTANHFSFEAEYVDAYETFQDETDLDKAIRIETNIELLMKRVATMEKEIDNVSPSFFMARDLYDQYQAAKANVSRCISESKAARRQCKTEEDMLRLTASSWGVFMSLNDPQLEARYRLRASEGDNLYILERIKLAQYALREKQLKLQGRLMELEDAPTGTVSVTPPQVVAEFDQDAFQ